MSLLALIVAIVIVGVVMYLINRFIPMEANIKTLLNVAVVIILVLWVLKAMGLFGSLANIRI